MPIRLGDGTALDLPDFQEVRLGDGTVIYSGGSSVTVVDDFEDGGITEYAGDSGPFSVQTATVYNGSNALEYTGSTTGAAITDTDQLTAPAQGDTFAAHHRSTSVGTEGAGGHLFAVQSETGLSSFSGYGAAIIYSVPSIKINRWDSGSITTLSENIDISISANTWYELETQWTASGDITVTLNDSGTQVGQTSATDTTYTSGGVGWYSNRGSTSESSFMDYYVIK